MINKLHDYHLLMSCVFSRKGAEFVASLLFLIAGLMVLMIALTAFSRPAHAVPSRIKDIVSVEGVRDNILVGYGLVVGLNGTGDKTNNSVFTEKSLKAYLTRLGLNPGDTQLKVKNVAAVTVTSMLPPFARNGAQIDVRISTMGDAKSIQGGTLIATPLVGADGEVYALAQGAISVGGFEASGASGTTVSKGVPTSGFISNGAIVEREIGFELNSLSTLKLGLRNPDLTTAKTIADAINKDAGITLATTLDPGTVQVKVPDASAGAVADFLAHVEQIQIQPDQAARVIIDEASGTIVMNENVKIDTVAVAQGNLIVTVEEQVQVSQPGALAPDAAATVVVPTSTVSVDEGGGNKLALMDSNATLGDLVKGLNALGVGPRDLIGILESIKAAGALQAEIVTR